MTAPTRSLPALAAAALTALTLACGGSPSGPSPSPGGPPPAPTPNAAPVIASVEPSLSRAEVDTDITLTATVTDAETPVGQLQFAWSAEAGSFAGTGPTVTWRIPPTATTPKEYSATLTVTETYGTADASGARPKHTVTASSPQVSVHNSPRELGDLSLEFLRDFANSAVDPATAVRNFSDSCSGKQAELGDIDDNRRRYEILSSSLSLSGVSIADSQMRANVSVACGFSSRIRACDAGIPNCVVGAVENVHGTCRLTGIYEEKRWRLCTSNFDAATVLPPAFRSFMGASRER